MKLTSTSTRLLPRARRKDRNATHINLFILTSRYHQRRGYTLHPSLHLYSSSNPCILPERLIQERGRKPKLSAVGSKYNIPHLPCTGRGWLCREMSSAEDWTRPRRCVDRDSFRKPRRKCFPRPWVRGPLIPSSGKSELQGGENSRQVQVRDSKAYAFRTSR